MLRQRAAGLRTAPMSAARRGFSGEKHPGQESRGPRDESGEPPSRPAARTGASWGLPATQWTGTWAASSSTSSPECGDPQSAAISVGGGARRHGGSARKTTRGARRWRAVPAPGSVASPVSARDGEDVRVDAAPAARGGGRSVVSSASRGPTRRPTPRNTTKITPPMLTAEEEALRARTALMQRDAERSRARAPSASSRRRCDLARHRGRGANGRGHSWRRHSWRRRTRRRSRWRTPSAPRFPPRRRDPSPPRRRRRSPNSTRSVFSTSAHSPQTRRGRRGSRLAADGGEGRAGTTRQEYARPPRSTTSLRSERTDRGI